MRTVTSILVVDALMDAVQAARLRAVADRAVPQPEGAELPARDDTVLPRGDRRDGSIARGLDECCRYIRQCSSRPRHARSVAGESALGAREMHRMCAGARARLRILTPRSISRPAGGTALRGAGAASTRAAPGRYRSRAMHETRADRSPPITLAPPVGGGNTPPPSGVAGRLPGHDVMGGAVAAPLSCGES
jgi:hypothetical protein